jgi:isopentenyl-diphosphate delta-isomerase
MENLILVDTADNVMGYADKMKIHQEGLLHRAFSVFLFNATGEMLLQQRALHKYHSPGLWTNACCSHPHQNETVEEAIYRRLNEELGLSKCEVEFLYKFIYRAEFDNGLTEHEYDHVYVGMIKEEPTLNPEEVKQCRFITINELDQEIQTHPERFTYWFKVSYPEVKKYWKNKFTL